MDDAPASSIPTSVVMVVTPKTPPLRFPSPNSSVSGRAPASQACIDMILPRETGRSVCFTRCRVPGDLGRSQEESVRRQGSCWLVALKRSTRSTDQIPAKVRHRSMKLAWGRRIRQRAGHDDAARSEASRRPPTMTPCLQFSCPGLKIYAAWVIWVANQLLDDDRSKRIARRSMLQSPIKEQGPGGFASDVGRRSASIRRGYMHERLEVWPAEV